MPRTEIRITGYGGQGVILTGYIFGRAAAIHADLHSTMTQSFGPEARGSACSSALVVDDGIIAYPYLNDTDVLIALSREGYEKYKVELKTGGTLIYDSDMVQPQDTGDVRMYGVPAARIAEELGNRIVQNIVVVGFTTAVTDLVDVEAVKKSVKGSVPSALVDMNLEAFRKGYEFYQK
ncbi:MAG: pyruvate ferredoxin oxidoreductase [bacterium]|nr:pyruvate ferredoxin oxidoreductase [bacterium]